MDKVGAVLALLALWVILALLLTTWSRIASPVLHSAGDVRLRRLPGSTGAADTSAPSRSSIDEQRDAVVTALQPRLASIRSSSRFR